jgi:hypothetical protein
MEVASSTPVVKLAEATHAVDMIVDGIVDSVIIDDAYLLVYEVATPWHSNKQVVHELMVLRLRAGSNFNAVCDTLDDIAEGSQAAAILVGGALTRSPEALVRLYKARGYELDVQPSLIKWR